MTVDQITRIINIMREGHSGKAVVKVTLVRVQGNPRCCYKTVEVCVTDLEEHNTEEIRRD